MQTVERREIFSLQNMSSSRTPSPFESSISRTSSTPSPIPFSEVPRQFTNLFSGTSYPPPLVPHVAF